MRSDHLSKHLKTHNNNGGVPSSLPLGKLIANNKSTSQIDGGSEAAENDSSRFKSKAAYEVGNRVQQLQSEVDLVKSDRSSESSSPSSVRSIESGDVKLMSAEQYPLQVSSESASRGDYYGNRGGGTGELIYGSGGNYSQNDAMRRFGCGSRNDILAPWVWASQVDAHMMNHYATGNDVNFNVINGKNNSSSSNGRNDRMVIAGNNNHGNETGSSIPGPPFNSGLTTVNKGSVLRSSNEYHF